MRSLYLNSKIENINSNSNKNNNARIEDVFLKNYKGEIKSEFETGDDIYLKIKLSSKNTLEKTRIRFTWNYKYWLV